MKKVTNTKLYVKVVATLISFAFFFSSSPMTVFAETTTSGQTTSSNQATAYTNGSTSGGGNSSKSIVSDSGSCIASSILAKGISSVISSAIGALTTGAEKVTNALTTVTVNSPTHEDKTEVQKEAASGFTVPYTNTLIGVSWDGVAWCIANSLIEYIANSTIEWANSGFNGSPSFISNTDNFFENIADTEAGNFLNALANGSTTSGSINLCSNFKVSVSVGLSNYYNKGSSKKSSCTLTNIVKNVDSFMDGNFEQGGWEGWFSMTQSASNNKIGATIVATDALYAKVTAKNNTLKLDLGLNNGFLNYKKCDKKSDGTTDEKSCKTVTPGKVIESSLEKSLGLPKDRLAAVAKFDQVIEAVVNNLIKVALNEVLTSSSSK